MDDAGDREAICAVLAGDVDEYAVLVARYQKRIFNLMYRMTGSYSDAADLAQETFIKAYEKLHSFRMEKKFYPWLYTIGLNHSRNFLRQSKASQTISIEDCDLEAELHCPAQQEKSACARCDAQRLHEALLQLPVDYREAIILRYQEELSMEDIAAVLHLSLSGAKMRVHRGLSKLREILESGCHEKRENSA